MEGRPRIYDTLTTIHHRVGDAIVEVNGWLVARMSHPGTAISVFMAAGNTASVDVVSPFDGTFSQCAAMEAY